MAARSRVWPDPRVRPPFGAAEIDWGHSLAKNLTSFALFYGPFIVEMTQRFRWSLVVGASPRTGAAGAGAGPTAGSGFGVANISPGLAIAAGANWSDFLHYHATSFDGGSPGLWRSAGGGGNTFHIVQSSGTPRISVRLNGTDILIPGSGTVHPIGLQTTGVSCVSSASITEYINGAQTHTAGHAVATPAFSITPLGAQSDDTQVWAGVYYAFGLWSRALTAEDYAYLHAAPYAMLRTRVRRRYFIPATGGSTVPRKYHHYMSMH